MREYKRRKLKDLAGELEKAVSRNQVKPTYAMVQTPSSSPNAPTSESSSESRITSWDHDGEIDARRDALVNIFGPEPQAKLYTTRRKTSSGQSHNCQLERLDRALRTKVGTHVPDLLLMRGR